MLHANGEITRNLPKRGCLNCFLALDTPRAPHWIHPWFGDDTFLGTLIFLNYMSKTIFVFKYLVLFDVVSILIFHLYKHQLMICYFIFPYPTLLPFPILMLYPPFFLSHPLSIILLHSFTNFPSFVCTVTLSFSSSTGIGRINLISQINQVNQDEKERCVDS